MAEKLYVLEKFKEGGVTLTPSVDLQFICSVAPDAEVMKAAVAYDGFSGKTCQIHQYIPDPHGVTPRFLWAAFDYPFNRVKCVEIFGLVAESNKKAYDLDLHLGFKEVYRVTGGWEDGGDLIVMSMRREECRWLKLGRRFEHEYRKAA